MAFLEIRDVEKEFGATRVLRGINMAVDEHQVVCLIGPSGCGKSTLLRCINGLETIQGYGSTEMAPLVSANVPVNRARVDPALAGLLRLRGEHLPLEFDGGRQMVHAAAARCEDRGRRCEHRVHYPPWVSHTRSDDH